VARLAEREVARLGAAVRELDRRYNVQVGRCMSAVQYA
jgi:hypothetical protein